MTTLVVTTEMVLVDTRHTWTAASTTQTKIHQYRNVLYTMCGAVGGGQLQVYKFIDELLDATKPWPAIIRDSVDASYVLVVTEEIPHRHLRKGDVICIDIDAGTVSHDEYSNTYELTTDGTVGHLTKYIDGTGGQLYQTFLAVNPDPIVAFELAVEHDPYSGFPYQYIDRETCKVRNGFRLTDGQRFFAHVLTVAGRTVGASEPSHTNPIKGR